MLNYITAWFDKHFVSDWRNWWKWPEIRLAAAVPVVTTLAADNWKLLLNLLDYLPANSWLRGAIIAVVVLSTFVVPTITRLWDTEKPADESTS